MAAEVIACHTPEMWVQQLNMGNEAKKLGQHHRRSWHFSHFHGVALIHGLSQRLTTNQIVVDFTATWCGPCRIIAPIFEELAKKFTNVTFLKVDVDELKKVAEEYAVEAMPTFIFLKEGKILHKIVGARKEELVQTVEKLAVETAAA